MTKVKLIDIDPRIANGFMWYNMDLLVIVFNEHPNLNDNVTQSFNAEMIKTRIELESKICAFKVLKYVDRFTKYDSKKINEILKLNPTMLIYIFSQNKTIAVLNTEYKLANK